MQFSHILWMRAREFSQSSGGEGKAVRCRQITAIGDGRALARSR